MKLNELSGWRLNWIIFSIIWSLSIILYKSTDISFNSIDFNTWYPIIKAMVLPPIAAYFLIDIYRYSFKKNKNQLT